MPAETSFPQFCRLPPELRLQILEHHRDSLGRNHFFRNATLLYHDGNSQSTFHSSTLYDCRSLQDSSDIKNDAPDDDPAMADCIYTNDGLASERIPLYHDFRRWNSHSEPGPIRAEPAFYHGWANFATDVFTFTDTSMDVVPSPSIAAPNRGAVSPLDYRAHWFWRVQKLALEVGQDSLTFGYGLSEYDKEMLRRTTSALKTVYIVIDPTDIAHAASQDGTAPFCVTSPFWRCRCVAKPPFRTLVDGFVAPEDYLVAGGQGQSASTKKCEDRHGRYNLHAALRLATRLRGELEAVLREKPAGGGAVGGGRRRPVEVLVVFSENKGWWNRRWGAVARRPMWH
ncbi:hypothetical protein PG991_001533 [Apiospora marii]|uniref:Uncharacterized protein n=1 Tax=Apiospora marii TaxID=335849 RepID=A0ABR1SRD6_9PEZI